MVCRVPSKVRRIGHDLAQIETWVFDLPLEVSRTIVTELISILNSLRWQAVKDWFRILTDPDRNELERMIRVGQMVTWPKVSSALTLRLSHPLADT